MREIAATIRRAALDRAGGTIETSGGDLLLRLADRRDALDADVDLARLIDQCTSSSVALTSTSAASHSGLLSSSSDLLGSRTNG